MPVVGLDARAHAAERLGDPLHRPGAERRVAGQLELLPVLAREDPGEQADERAGVGAVDRPARRGEAAQALAEDVQRVLAVLVDRDPEGAHRLDRRLGVGGAAEAGDRASRRRRCAPRSTARWEIDLSPGTAMCPTRRVSGSTLIRRSRARRRRRSPAPRAGVAARSASSSPATMTVSVPPRSVERWSISKSSTLIRSAPSAWKMPASTPGRSGRCTRSRCSAPGSPCAVASMRRRLPAASAIQRASWPPSSAVERRLELLDPAAVLAERGHDRLAVVEEDVDPDPRVRAGDAGHVAQRAARRLQRVVAVDARRAGLVEEHVRERVRQVARDGDEAVVRAGVDRDRPGAERGDEPVHRAQQLRAGRRRSGSGTRSRPRTARRSRARGRASRRRRSGGRR